MRKTQTKMECTIEYRIHSFEASIQQFSLTSNATRWLTQLTKNRSNAADDKVVEKHVLSGTLTKCSNTK